MEELSTQPSSLMSDIRYALARFPDAVGWVIESGFRSAYENCALPVSSVKSNGPSFPFLSNARLWKIGGLPICAETEDDEPQTWGTLVGSDGRALVTVRVDRPIYMAQLS